MFGLGDPFRVGRTTLSWLWSLHWHLLTKACWSMAWCLGREDTFQCHRCIEPVGARPFVSQATNTSVWRCCSIVWGVLQIIAASGFPLHFRPLPKHVWWQVKVLRFHVASAFACNDSARALWVRPLQLLSERQRSCSIFPGFVPEPQTPCHSAAIITPQEGCSTLCCSTRNYTQSPGFLVGRMSFSSVLGLRTCLLTPLVSSSGTAALLVTSGCRTLSCLGSSGAGENDSAAIKNNAQGLNISRGDLLRTLFILVFQGLGEVALNKTRWQ